MSSPGFLEFLCQQESGPEAGQGEAPLTSLLEALPALLVTVLLPTSGSSHWSKRRAMTPAPTAARRSSDLPQATKLGGGGITPRFG
jgi:hypothetical protein